MRLEDLDLTPGQYAELNHQPPALLNAWLEALTLTSNVKSPTGWILAGIRTGQPPPNLDDNRKRHAIQQAETLTRNLGPQIQTEDELIDTLFSPPRLTADTETLDRLEADTRDHPGHHLFGDALKAQLDLTRKNGRQEIHTTGGPLHGYDSPELRQRLTQLWRSLQHADNDIDWETR